MRPSVARALHHMDCTRAPGGFAVKPYRVPRVAIYRTTVRRHLAGLLGCLPYLADPLPEERYAMEWITTFLRAPEDF